MAILIYNRKRKRKKDDGKTVQKPKGSKEIQSSKNGSVKKIHLCN